ncbi:aminodeoxychorismate synthase component I [Alcaligenes endophyticus]|uniref:Aminodeoxychorismate synthase component I n=1 Tax=Alcaligenes endophyticus TaxID=1929088 RepID=A0ABT8EH15_9BURK|nr:aminodeoxychorismate synthase component I [Alcaligenes endophyticus]MCX5589758.1 aminodeoxychorismate synthase component I [Alcaligenes endophyticus]MDN4120579.1 aminodeoxychorismate synthase component I [Alcaligenes endophyticus]
MYIRFEDRIKQKALELQGPRALIQASHAQELNAAFAAIEQAHQDGYWIGLVLNYELAQLWEPRLLARRSRFPLLSALVFEQAVPCSLWNSSHALALTAKATISEAIYHQHIAEIQADIRAGDFYQINYSLPLQISSPMPTRELYTALASRHPVAYACYVELENRRILSLSPELFLHKQGLHIGMRPMKGTMPRHADPKQDEAAAQTLANSEKDRAENVMIVDLLRNDLGCIAEIGSVHMDSLFDIERYESVWTMTSSLQARLQPNTTLAKLLHAVFPCGSITGAPKLAAMQKIRALETHERGIYCGALGYWSPEDELQLSVAIRTLELDAQGQGILGVGGGIVHDSDAANEWQECMWKARILNTTIQAQGI